MSNPDTSGSDIRRARKPQETDLVTELTNNLAASQKRDEAQRQERQGSTQQARQARDQADDIETRNLDPNAVNPRPDLALAGLITVLGFTVGRMDASRCRLYLSYRMDEFVEFEDDDVMGHRKVEAAQFPPLGGVVMWLKRGANLIYTRVTSRQVQADLLSGSFTQAHQAELSAGGQQANGNGASAAAGDAIGAYVGIQPQITTFSVACPPPR